MSGLLQLLTATASGQINLAYWLLVTLVGGYILIDASSYFAQHYLQERWLNQTVFKVRERLMDTYLADDAPLSADQGASDNQFNQLTNNLNILQNDYLRSAVLLYGEAWQLVIALGMAGLIHPILAIVIVALCIPSLLVPIISRRILRHSKTAVIAESAAYTNVLQGLLSGLRTIQLLNVGRMMQPQFRQHNQAWLDKLNLDQRNRKLVSSLSQFVDDFMYLGTWIAGIYFVLHKTISLAQLVAFSQLIVFVADPMQTGAGLLTDYLGAKPVADQINVTVKATSANPASNLAEPLNTMSYSHVTVKHKAQTVLADVSLQLDCRHHYLIVGKTGAGKSTLLTLPLLAHTGYTGTITLNGQNQKALNLTSIRTHIGLVEQTGALFPDSLRANLTLGRTATTAQIVRVLQAAQLSSYATPAGLAKALTVNGSELSGGERKRLMLARALLQPTDLLLFDEPTTGLDPRTANAIEAMMMSLPQGWLMVTHRYNPELFAFADEVIVMASGNIVAQGPANSPHIQKALKQLQFEA